MIKRHFELFSLIIEKSKFYMKKWTQSLIKNKELQTLENFQILNKEKKEILRDIFHFLLIQMIHPESPVKKKCEYKRKKRKNKSPEIFPLETLTERDNCI